MYSLCIACSDPLGMENRKITDGQITASTEYNAIHGATNGRLNFKAGGGKMTVCTERTIRHLLLAFGPLRFVRIVRTVRTVTHSALI